MLFIKLLESLCNTRIYFRYFKALITKNGSTKYCKLIECFSQNLGGIGGGIPSPDKRYFGSTNFRRY